MAKKFDIRLMHNQSKNLYYLYLPKRTIEHTKTNRLALQIQPDGLYITFEAEHGYILSENSHKPGTLSLNGKAFCKHLQIMENREGFEKTGFELEKETTIEGVKYHKLKIIQE